jgi:hypothetical protein
MELPVSVTAFWGPDGLLPLLISPEWVEERKISPRGCRRTQAFCRRGSAAPTNVEGHAGESITWNLTTNAW